MTDFVSAFKLRNGVYTADKDVDDIDYWGVSIADILAEYPLATVVSIMPLLTGVSIPVGEQPTLQGVSDVVALFAGGDVTSEDAVNECTFRILFSNKVQRDRTIAFRMVKK